MLDLVVYKIWVVIQPKKKVLADFKTRQALAIRKQYARTSRNGGMAMIKY